MYQNYPALALTKDEHVYIYIQIYLTQKQMKFVNSHAFFSQQYLKQIILKIY